MASLDDRLDLADWRRAVASLYAEVRELAASDPEAAWDRWRARREALYRDHRQSPVPPAARSDFRARHWPYDPTLRFEVEVQPPADDAADPATVPGAALAGGPLALGTTAIVPASAGATFELERIGRVSIDFSSGRRSLDVFWMVGYAGGLFLPFRDATNGAETYGAGRYLLDGAKGADLGPGRSAGSLVLDFNFAFQPSCAFDARWACPLAPPENRLDLRVEAGERIA